MLNLNVEERFDSTQIQLSGWASMQPITRPRSFSQQKYTIENCLPQLLHRTRPSTPCEESGCPMVLTSPYPLMQPIGCGHNFHHPLSSTGSHVVTMHIHQEPADSVHHHHSHAVRQAYTQIPSNSVAEHTSTTSTGPAYPPQAMQGVNPQLHSHGQQIGGQMQTYTQAKRPLVAKIGAAGRRIADAVKQVGHHSKGHSVTNSRHGSAGSSKSIVS